MEFDLDVNNLEPININFDNAMSPTSPKDSVNFGGGIELLMNNKRRENSQQSGLNVEFGELDKLENELNELSGMNSRGGGGGGETKKVGGGGSGFSNFFGLGNPFASKEQTSHYEQEQSDSKLGEATINSVGNTNGKTWDGYQKINEIPLDHSHPKMNEREKRRKKRIMLKKLDEWHEKGIIKNSSHFDMESSYEEIEDEYETCLEDKRKKDSVKLQGWWFMTLINSLEYGNSVLNPFDLNLDGWGEQVSEDIDSYEEIFAELHEKYKGGKLSPEISLLLRIGFSAAVVNITNKALSTATPGFNDVIKQSPELMKMFTNATVETMNKQNTNPNSNMSFMSNILGGGGGGGTTNDINTSFGPPPPPVETKNQLPSMQYTTQHQNIRPDIMAGRGTMFQEKGVDIHNAQKKTNDFSPPNTFHQTQENILYTQQTPNKQRPEMRGPPEIDINNILSGLKTKETPVFKENVFEFNDEDNNDSFISVSSLRDMQNIQQPKKKRKQKSEKNIVSLDI